MIIINYLTMRFFNIKIIITLFEIFYYRKFFFYLRIIDFIVYALKRIEKKFINKNKKYIFSNYENEFIFYLYNLIKKKIIRINNIYFIKKCFYFINLEKKIKIYEFLNKRQYFFILIFVVKETLNK